MPGGLDLFILIDEALMFRGEQWIMSNSDANKEVEKFDEEIYNSLYVKSALLRMI